MINNYTREDLFQMYLNRQWPDIEQIIQESRIPELKQWAKDTSLVWYQGSKTSLLEALQLSFAQRRAITGEEFCGQKGLL